MMVNTHELCNYLRAHCVDFATRRIDDDADDLMLIQAAADGYVDFIDGHWYARGTMQPGERRRLRYIGGGEAWIEE